MHALCMEDYDKTTSDTTGEMCGLPHLRADLLFPAQ
jgi:hypothetical protein